LPKSTQDKARALSYIEPWLRGPLPGVHPSIAPVLYSLQQAREDLRKWTEGFSTEEIWLHIQGLAPIGFQIRHISRSVERLMTYVVGGQLTGQQLSELRGEMEPGASLDELFSELEQKLSAAEAIIRAIDPGTVPQPREVGRKRLPTTVGGLLTHIAEHTQRHVGQAIVTAKLVTRPGIAPARP
jgi:DinB family protein